METIILSIISIIVSLDVMSRGGVFDSSDEKGGAEVDANIKKLIALAEQEIGYLEKKSNDQQTTAIPADGGSLHDCFIMQQ
jgi:hypothetical protein